MSTNALKKRVFENWPKIEEEIEELGLEVEFADRYSFYLHEDAQYRYIHWKPCNKRDNRKRYRLYNVYFPSVRYVFSVYPNPYPMLVFAGARFVDGERLLQYALPNDGCLGSLPIQYNSDNTIGDLISNFWSSGFNADLFLGPFFANMHHLNEPYEKNIQGHSVPLIEREFLSYELFEKWEQLTPEEVMLCATHFDAPEGLLVENEKTVNA